MSRIFRDCGVYPSTVTVADGAQVSSTIDKQNHAGVGIGFPSTLEGTSIGWQCSADGATWFDYYEDDAIYAETIADDSCVASPAALFCWPFIRVKIGTAQTGALTLVVVRGS